MMPVLIAAGIGIVFAVGIYQILRRNLIRSAIGLVILSNAANLFLVACGSRWGLFAPYSGSPAQTSDPLPQALVLTAIVIAMGGFAFVLAVVHVVALRGRTGDSDDIDRLKN
jgi:multicomponent Na+:H+ antiporter subunit C